MCSIKGLAWVLLGSLVEHFSWSARCTKQSPGLHTKIPSSMIHHVGSKSIAFILQPELSLSLSLWHLLGAFHLFALYPVGFEFPSSVSSSALYSIWYTSSLPSLFFLLSLHWCSACCQCPLLLFPSPFSHLLSSFCGEHALWLLSCLPFSLPSLFLFTLPLLSPWPAPTFYLIEISGLSTCHTSCSLAPPFCW